MAFNKQSANLLPEYLKTDKNSKFLSGTIDPLIQTPQLERVDGFVGSRITPNYNPLTDYYLKESLPLRSEYSLEPALVFKDKSSNITDVVAFDDIINEIKIQGGKTDDLDTLFKNKFYSYDPYIDWDKLVNYNQYYWLTTGPDNIVITTSTNIFTNIIGTSTYTMPNGYKLSNGMKVVFTTSFSSGTNIITSGTSYIVEGVGSSIKLIDFKLLKVNSTVAIVYNETFDGDAFDSYPFDGDSKLPVIPEYITINRASNDLNPWSRYNRWFHADIIKVTAEINKQSSVIYPLDKRAKRPIIEFKPNIQLYNFGNKGIRNVDLIDIDTTSTSLVDGTLGYYVDGVLLEKGNRVIFNASTSTIFIVNYDVTTNPPTLRLIADTSTNLLNSVEVNYGYVNSGTTWHYTTKSINNVEIKKWWKSQQHTILNQAPLFDLYNKAGISYTETNSNFTGNKIFGYDVGTGKNDNILGFPLKYQNSVGVGSYLFKNYFMSDEISLINSDNISYSISAGITYFKVNGELKNVWKTASDYKTPIVEIQTISTSTSSVIITSITSSATSVSSIVNGSLVSSSLGNDGLSVIFDSKLSVDDTVSLEITANSIPNSNGFYKTPISLTNNPLNGNIETITLSELSDHLSTMITSDSNFSGVFPGVSNLRDITGYSIYGKRLIINANPIAFSQIFLGKKEHNVIDAIRYVADQYNQFKMNLFKAIANVNSQLTPADALDVALKEINVNRDTRSPYYNSDMLGYGPNKKTSTKVSTVAGPNQIVYISELFDLTILSIQAIFVYVNDVQLIHGTDYIFDNTDFNTVEILKSISIDDIITVNYYSNTNGSFIPATPSKLGLYPKYKPFKYTDTSFVTTDATVIQCHDGSIIKAYDDYRDDIILEYEKRVYNNIKINYDKNIFDVLASMPGAFRNNDYSLDDTTDILAKDFVKWTGIYNIDVTTNILFDEGNSFSWNYVGSVDNLFGSSVSGYWRGLYKYFYDTDRPHTHPWEMLGHIEKPSWWNAHYDWINPVKRTALITAILHGYTNEPPDTTINSNYARSGFMAIVPVSLSGELLSPDQFLVSNNSYYDKNSEWKFGDHGPAETAWRRSSYWPFVSNILAATLYPSSYTPSMYDVSRITFNMLEQIIYNNDLYLNPSKLLIDGDVQTAGYGVYVVEKGKQKNLDYISSLKQDLAYINFNLFHKLGGFASKDKLQIIIDSIDPVSQAPGAILPLEDYSLILNVSNPIKSSSISGIIIQRSNGKFIIKGYDKNNPYFNILKPNKQSQSNRISVGGVSSAFTDWTGVVNNGNSGLSSIDITSASPNTTHYYKTGQIVRYNGAYYIVKVGHTSQSVFDSTLFQKLPELPMTGGATVLSYSKFENETTKVIYGTSFSNIQDVYDLLVGYGAYLESQGFIFDEYNSDLSDIINWKFTGKEFLYWTTQNWADGNLITLSPFADYLKYSFLNSIVDDIAYGQYEYSLLKADGKSFPIDKFRLSREDGICIINTIDTLDGMFFATLNSIQKEHGMVFNNTTIFNDTIYDIETGYKQRRIKLSGFRTLGWNGDLSSPGFVYDNVKITDWNSYGIYLPGNIVRYNGSYYEANVKITNDATFDFNKWTKLNGKPESNLLPNFDYKINQFEDFYSLDIDNFDATQQQLAQHLVGYTPRTYFNNIFTNPITQYKFYQGFIKEKGTKNAIDKLDKVGKFTRQGNIKFNEDWAFRIGEYGSFNTYNEIEFSLDESGTLENPYIVKLVDKLPADKNPLINYILSSELLLVSENNITTSTFVTNPATFFDNNLTLITAGYVRIDDVTATAYNKNSLLDIANNSVLSNGDTIWLGFLENGNWGVSRYSKQPAKIAGVYVSAPANSITFTTDRNHELLIGEIVSIVRFNDQVNGIHIITDIPRLDQFTVASSLTTIVNADLLSYGELFKFETARYANIEEISNIKNLLRYKEGEKLWIDEGTDEKWQVYEKRKTYSTATNYPGASTPLNQHLGQSIYSSDDSDVVMVSSPGYTIPDSASIGTVKLYKKNRTTKLLNQYFDYTLGAGYCTSGANTQFGYSIAYDSNKKLYFTGAPGASNVVINNSDIGVKYIQIFSTSTLGTAKGFDSEGVVKIHGIDSNKEIYTKVLVSPSSTTTYTASHLRFGHSLYINQPDANTNTTLLVGAPGDDTTSTTGYVYAYSVTPAFNIVIQNPIWIHPNGSLTPGSQFGHKIAGDTAGTIIAISAPKHVQGNNVGMVQLFDKTLSWFQTIYSPFGTSAEFGNDVAVSSDGSLMFISSTNLKVPGDFPGKVAVYKKTGTGVVFQYKTSRARVILAFAAEQFAPLYYGEETLLYWMINGEFVTQDDVDAFAQYWIDHRAAHPEDAALWDAQRAADSLNALSSRFYVIGSYQDNADAPLYPTEENIRYWMLTGIDNTRSNFNAAIVAANLANPKEYRRIIDERALAVSLLNYIYSLHQIIDNPLQNNNLNFGQSIVISKDNKTLVISSLGINKSEFVKFDENSKKGETTFDGDTTKFINSIPDSGTVLVYNNLNGYFIIAEELTDESILENSKYGSSLFITRNDVFIGYPTDIEYSGTDKSGFSQFSKTTDNGSWILLREQDRSIDITTIDRVALIDSIKEEVVEYLDIIDPLKGKIAGIAEQELKYKSVFDPAIYTIGRTSSIVDTESSWIDDHIGELWWDLSTAKYQWYEQGDDIVRKNNWGKLFPGASIDVYEWVKSDLMPSEWAAQADTNAGLTKGISGQPKYPDNSIVSIKQKFNNVTNSFENVYFFWVKNKVTVPDAKNRRISGYQVASIIADPISNGLKFIEILSTNSLAFANIQSMLIGNRINANISIDTTSNEIPKHTEWLLLSEGDPNGIPPASIEKKLFDSTLGHDPDGNKVPAIGLTYRNKYGIGIRPQQSLFKDRIEALRNIVEFANSILIKNRITSNYSFDNLTKIDPIPDIFYREFDATVESLSDLDNISTTNFAQAIVECQVDNGKIISADIISSGYGYMHPPMVTIISDTDNMSDAEILTEIDNDGKVVNLTISNSGDGYASAPELIVRPQTIIVEINSEYGNRWTKHQYDYNSLSWMRIKNQTYNTPLYWGYVDWSSEEFNSFKEYPYVLNGLYELDSAKDVLPGEYVKVNNVVEGNYIILERVSNNILGNFSKNYDIVFVKNGTIQILDTLWNYSESNYAYDIATLDETLYDQIPDLEVFNILYALKHDIFINDLRVNWNLLFFVAVKYALTEQKLLDWAFKTSFINITNFIGTLDQRPVYKLDNEQYFEDYINEVKPYHTQIRKYTSNYTYLDNTNEISPLSTTDFDLPPYYNTVTNKFEVVGLSNSLINIQPWKSWADNYTSEIGEIVVSNNGTLYTERPIVSITGGGTYVTSTATAEAYIRNGGIYKVVVTNPGAGYTENPVITITGGGSMVHSTATASARLLNLKTRKNLIGIKFDRVNANSEIGITRVTDTFTCTGDTDKFVLTWLADPNKENIIPTLDKQLILSTDYTIEYYTEEYNGYTKKYSRFLFLNVVPSENQIFRITYNKNINLYTAVDRIEHFYTSTAILSSLMTGTVYPGSIIQGLPFDYSVPWDTVQGNGGFGVDNSTWSELVNYYTTAKLISTATFGATTLYLNTTTGIVPGQVINILNSSTIRIRPDTIVNSVNTSTRSITISKPSYRIINAISTATAVGSSITVRTTPPFNGSIVKDDDIIITGITSSGYNGTYKVFSVLDADQFYIKSTSVLSTTKPIISLVASATIVTLLTTIESNNVLLNRYEGTYKSVLSRIIVNLDTLYDDIYKISVFLNGSPSELETGIPIVGPYPGAEYYHMTKGSDGKAIASFYQMTTLSYNIQLLVYGRPTIEFWKPDTLVSKLDTSISGGTLAAGVSGAIIDGDAFLNVRNGYAPEELVAGHSLDSVGINVYTKADNSYATVISGSFPVTAGEITTATIGMNSFAGLMIHYNEKNFNRLTSLDTNAGPYFSAVIGTRTPDDLPPLLGQQLADDYSSGPFSLGFEWNMFGTTFNQVSVGTNGYLTFGSTQFGFPDIWTPLTITALPFPAIFIQYCDLWQNFGLNNQPLISGEAPGLFSNEGTVENFAFWRLRFQGSHYVYRNAPIAMPAFNYEVTLYTNGTDQYIEIIYETVWRGTNVNGDVGFVAGVASANGVSNISIPYTSIDNNSSHVFYSTANGGNWQYAGVGKFNPFRNPFAFTTSNQYYTLGDTIYLAPQIVSGRAGYTAIDVGGNRSVIDSNMILVSNTNTAIVESLAIIDDIRSAYVLVDGIERSDYILTSVGNDNNRACIKIVNLSSIPHTITAWFFESKYTKFNKVNEEFITASTSTSVFILSTIPGVIEPVSEEVIVELGQFSTPSTRTRLLPPKTSYYKVRSNLRVFDIDSQSQHPQNTYSDELVKVYANGVELRPGFDYTVDVIFSTITLADGLLHDGDVLAVVALNNQDFIITDNILKLTNSVNSGTTLKITSFTDHDNMLLRTERFKGNGIGKFKLAFPVIYDSYVWVYQNGIPLTSKYDFEILDNSTTIQINSQIIVKTTDDILITTVNPPSYGSQILGYRVFNDMFNRQHFKRMSTFYSTTLSRPLAFYDTEIYVTDATKLIPPNPLTNKPGVVLIDGERIEFMVKDGNILRQLRRSTLGTGSAPSSTPGTTVIDQSLQQTIPYNETISVQTTSTMATTYVINTLSNLVTGDGITLTSGIDAIHQLSIYYGGRELRKQSLTVHDSTKAYDTTSTSILILPPEFTITTSTQLLTLNVLDQLSIDTNITIVQKTGYVWTGTESLLTSDVTQAHFLQEKEAALPDIYYYGGFQTSTIIAEPITGEIQAGNPSFTAFDIIVSFGGPAIFVGIGPRLPKHGIVTTLINKVYYKPDSDWQGVDMFDYYVVDKFGNKSYAPVTISTWRILVQPIEVLVPYGAFEFPIEFNDALVRGGPIGDIVLDGEQGGTVFDAAGRGSWKFEVDGAVTFRLKFTAKPGYVSMNDQIYIGYTAFSRYYSSSYSYMFVRVSPPAGLLAGDFLATVATSSTNFFIEPIIISGGPVVEVGIATQPGYGTVTVINNFMYYTPTPGFQNARDTFTYYIKDNEGNISTGRIYARIFPVAILNDLKYVYYNSTENLFVVRYQLIGLIDGEIQYEIDPVQLDKSKFVISISTPPQHGIATTSTLNILYTPTPGWVGLDTFGVNLTDNYGRITTGVYSIETILIIALPIEINVPENSNNYPIKPKSYETIYGIRVDTPPSHGILTVDNNNFLLFYTPDPGWLGSDEFAYSVQDQYGYWSLPTIGIITTV